MIGALLASLLAVAAFHDTTSRVPGTTLRFGAESGRFGAAQGFQPTAQQQPPDQQAREGALRFFGIDAQATLKFRDRRLVQAAFVIESASPQQIAYIGDDLVRRGYHRRCTVLTRERSRCTWLGATHVEMTRDGGRISAKILPLTAEERAARGGSPALAAAPADTGRYGMPMRPDTLALPPGWSGESFLIASAPLPAYPASARAAGVQGIVRTLARVDTSGAVVDVQITRSIAELDSAAIATVRAMRFRPLTRDGRPAGGWVRVPVTFLLH